MKLAFLNQHIYSRPQGLQGPHVKYVPQKSSCKQKAKRVVLLRQIDGRVRQVQEDFYRGQEPEPPDDDKDEKLKDDLKLYTGVSMIILAFASIIVRIHY
jgi:hypothetical protein